MALLVLGLASCRRASDETPASPRSEPVEPAEPPAEPVEPPAEPAEPEVPDCAGQPCPPPRECIEYFGVAGPSGPSLFACEIRCERDASPGTCPEGTRCVTIADGPGEVCR